jgi:hypothetical protein
MIENTLHLRVIENKDWATLLFVVSFAIIAFTKSVFENRFADFVKLLYSNKYITIYKDSSHLKSGFTIALFLVQIISFSFLIQILLSYFGHVSKTDWVFFVQTITFLMYFVMAKFLIEKIIATAFNIEDFMEHFSLQKVIYRTYVGLFILPINVVLFYYEGISKNIPLLIIGLLFTVNTVVYLVSIKNYQNLIFSKLFYFILYLCALEIAPYYFMYYWFTKSIA